jgi:outer membrane protein
MRKLILAVLSFCLFPAFVAGAEDHAVGLQEALKIAMENNHEIRAFGNALSAQGEDIGIARSFLLAKLIFEERFMRTNNPTYSFMAKLNQRRFSQADFAISSLNNPNAVSDFQTSLSFEQPLFARRVNIALDIAKKEYLTKNEDYARKRQEIALRVVQAYLMVLTTKEYIAVSGKAEEDAREHLRTAELRYNAGVGLYSDTLRASTALAEAGQRKVTAWKNHEVAKRTLGLLLARTEPVEAEGGPVEIPLMDIGYYTGAAQERQDVRSLQLRYDNAKNSLSFADAGYLPVVAIGGSYQFNDHRRPFGTEGESWQVTAFLRWELFDGMKREHERSKAKYQMSETEEQLNGLKKAVSVRVYEAYLTVKEAMKNAELSQAALRSAEEGKRLVEERYRNSLSPIIDLLDAQVSLDHARANDAARQNERRLAVVNLAYESGTIMKDLGME